MPLFGTSPQGNSSGYLPKHCQISAYLLFANTLLQARKFKVFNRNTQLLKSYFH
ncbi:hypothetical protein N475_19345 [Pseudoalteromonas luteoviolacea DSM 6061]|uniref:Uncharacterized protein n=1 Tax=Pseudoalteromonas luteoviolacea DSM 6061 TaxID=1365250 RepID=A0A166VXD0_9GAMM|nr:hypothetical protein N475_19345 [Pseudoalteromonas luteoviolacea DSM 6061]